MNPCKHGDGKPCNNVRVGEAFDVDQCRICWRYVHDADFNRQFGGDGKTTLAPCGEPQLAGDVLEGWLVKTGIKSRVEKWIGGGGCGGCSKRREKLNALHRWARRKMRSSVRINHGAGGLGDALQGLLAVGAYRRRHPNTKVEYRVSPYAVPFVSLFDGGFDSLSVHDFDGHRECPPPTGDMQMNVGHRAEYRNKGAEPRWVRYARNLGVTGSVLPWIRDEPGLRKLGKPFAGYIALAPFSTQTVREYARWYDLEDLLIARGYQTVILHWSLDRCKDFKGVKVTGRSAAEVAGIILESKCLIAIDSGLAHLAGVLQHPTIVLLGQVTQRSVFGCYPEMKCLHGKLPCNGCFWQTPYNFPLCNPCPSIAEITPEEILNHVASPDVHDNG